MVQFINGIVYKWCPFIKKSEKGSADQTGYLREEAPPGQPGGASSQDRPKIVPKSGRFFFFGQVAKNRPIFDPKIDLILARF